MKLSQKISIGILFVTLFTVGLAGFFVFTGTKSALQKLIGDNQLEVTRQTMDKIDRLLYERYLDIFSVAESTVFLSQYQEGAITISQEDLKKEFNENTILTGPWDFLFAVDKLGTIVIATDDRKLGQSILYNKPYEQAFEHALQGGVYFSDFEVSTYTSKPTIIFAAPIKSKQFGHPILGVVIGNFAWPAVLEVLEELKEAAYLYNAQGLLIGSSDVDKNNEDLLRNDSKNVIVQNAIEGREKSDIFPHSIHGVSPVLASYVPQLGYLNYKGSGWKLIVETTTSVAFGPAQKEARQLAMVTGIVSLFAALFIFMVINHSVVQPVAALTMTASIIAGGDLARRAPVRSRDEIGKLAESFNTMTDSLLEARKFPENLIHSMGDGIIAFNRDGRVEIVNPQTEHIFLMKQSELKGKDIRELSAFPLLRPLTEMLLKKSENIKEEVVLHENMTVEVTTISLGSKEQQNGSMIVIHDITREKQIEQLKTEFVSIAAHQLRTPLSALKWAVNLLLSGDLGHIVRRQKEILEKAYQTNERMILLVNDLLNVERIEKEGAISRPSLLDVVELIQMTLLDFQEKQKEKKIKIIFKLSKEKLPKIFADEGGLRLVIQNLVANAIQYTNAGGLVTISAYREDHAVTVSVQDDGIGIPKYAQARVFTKFFRGENAIHMETQGSGLGLFIAKNIVESHRGKIWFESEEGKGSTFYFTIPTVQSS
ncbi:MAG: hypothetical protein G01um101448_570 [Parcubacteria group bacterium Gr01-1014_48]|nr:MAG: hypothetical protein Greene041614_204 [Parcubacteria group bacterium Greene0416_14]TSC73764.1 MAG: hypothetical protein G01um101448_570 [Parcubacteria group bacterium Gr01-1014_48]TSD01192.1 MAG: hypothetical protein Greene101415_387 [Parcubacteria group bacterium Greene1014_15]TSD08197.1 MAG: hypothetical protein Greene07144_328 [Parcubacteria group bacterium Greene0714_4]